MIKVEIRLDNPCKKNIREKWVGNLIFENENKLREYLLNYEFNKNKFFVEEDIDRLLKDNIFEDGTVSAKIMERR